MRQLRIILVILFGQLFGVMPAIERMTPDVNSPLSVLTMDKEERIIEEKVIIDINQVYPNSPKEFSVFSQVIENHLIDPRFIDYSVSKIVLVESGLAFVIGQTNKNTYFIGRLVLGNNKKIIYSIILEREQAILDMTSVSSPVNYAQKQSGYGCLLYLYWLEKTHNLAIYRGLYLFPHQDGGIDNTNHTIRSVVYNIQRYHTFSNYARDARIRWHEESRQLFIVIAAARSVMWVKLQSLVSPLPPLLHVIKYYNYSRACVFTSALHDYSDRHLIVLMACHLWHADSNKTRTKLVNNYMIVDVFNHDTLTSWEPMAKDLIAKQQPFNLPAKMLHQLIRTIEQNDNTTQAGFMCLFTAGADTTLLFDNNSRGWAVYDGSPDNSDMTAHLFSTHLGRPLLIEKYMNSIFSYTAPKCRLDPLPMQQTEIAPRLAKKSQNKQGTSELAGNDPQIYKKKLADNASITLNCFSVIEGKKSENPHTKADKHEVLWVPVTLGIISILLFLVIMVLLFIIRRNMSIQ